MGNFLSAIFEDDASFELEYFSKINAICGKLSKSCVNYGMGHHARDLCLIMDRYKTAKERFDEYKTKDNYLKIVKLWPAARDRLFMMISRMYEKYYDDFLVVRLHDFIQLQQKIIKHYAFYTETMNKHEICEKKLISNIDIVGDSSIDPENESTNLMAVNEYIKRRHYDEL